MKRYGGTRPNQIIFKYRLEVFFFNYKIVLVCNIHIHSKHSLNFKIFLAVIWGIADSFSNIKSKNNFNTFGKFASEILLHTLAHWHHNLSEIKLFASWKIETLFRNVLLLFHLKHFLLSSVRKTKKNLKKLKRFVFDKFYRDPKKKTSTKVPTRT